MTLKLIDDAAIITDYAMYLYKYFAAAHQSNHSMYLDRPVGEVRAARQCVTAANYMYNGSTLLVHMAVRCFIPAILYLMIAARAVVLLRQAPWRTDRALPCRPPQVQDAVRTVVTFLNDLDKNFAQVPLSCMDHTGGRLPQAGATCRRVAWHAEGR